MDTRTAASSSIELDGEGLSLEAFEFLLGDPELCENLVASSALTSSGVLPLARHPRIAGTQAMYLPV